VVASASRWTLPAGWEWVQLGDLCEIVGGGTPSRRQPDYFQGDIPWATPTDLTQLGNKQLCDTRDHITRDALEHSSARLVPAGTVLLTSRATIGATAVAMRPVCTNQGFANFVCSAKLNASYLAYYLEHIRQFLVGLAAGTTFKEISKRTLRKVRIPLAPTDEQRSIVAKLDRIEQAMQAQRAAIEKTKALLRAALAQVFDVRDGLPEGWQMEPVSELVAMRGGGTPSKRRRDYWDGTVPWVSPKDMTHFEIDDAQDHISDAAIGESAAFLAPPQSVLIVVRSGILARRFPIAINAVPAAINQDMKALIPRERILTRYLAYALRGKDSEILRRVKRGTTVHSLSADSIASLQIPLPSVAVQQRIAARLDRVQRALDLGQDNLLNLNALMQSALHRAFRGRL
jgi:type I restriction enzyme S subunit